MQKKSESNQKQKPAKLRAQNKKIFFGNVLLFTLLICVGFMIIKNFDSVNTKRAELEHLKKVEDSLRIRNEELNSRLQMEVDNEYIERVAKEMGYRKPNSIIFHVYSE